MKEGSSVVKALSLAAVALLFLFLGREGPIELVTGVFDSDAPVEEVEVIESIEEGKSVVDMETYPVERVVDGDTLRVTVDGISESVRVLGINTPETEYSDRGAECFGAEASEHAKTLLEGISVQLTPDDSQDTRDKYDRILAYVTLSDGSDFGETMITNGYAHEYTFKGVAYKKQVLYKTTQSKAQENGVGLWAEGACEE